MMHMIATGWTNLGSLHPFVFGEAGGHDLVGVFDVATSWDGYWLWHPDYQIRFGNVPALGPVCRWRRVLRIACRRSSISPGRDGGNLLARKRVVIQEVSEARIGDSRRHHLHARHALHLVCISVRLRKCDEGHWRDLSRTMAHLAMLLQDRENVFVERRRS